MSLLQTICQRAAEKDLPVLLIGGHAVIAHGYQRNTFDIDLVSRTSNRSAWHDLLSHLGYEIFSERDNFSQFTASGEQEMDIDVMFVNDATFDKLLIESQPLLTLTPQAKAVSLQHLLALKCHALKHTHPGRTIKDMDDVIRLIEINSIDLENEEWKRLFLKHGTVELYEKLRRLSRQ